jgi:predicted dienelactone hydrolase
LKKFLYAIGVLIVLGVMAIGAITMTSTRVLPPSGNVPGYKSASLAVSHRGGEIPLHIWYPAKEGEPELIGQNALFYGHYVRRDAPLPASAPVVLLSHGSGGNAVQMGWLASHLANRGALVIATNHPGTTSRDSLPERTVQIWERPADLSAMLDWLEAGGLAGFHPGKDIITAGFSLGGHSALAMGGVRVSKARFIEYCVRNAGLGDCGWLQAGGVDFNSIDATRYEADLSDPRITRVIAIDPALPQAATPESMSGVQRPVLIINLGAVEQIPEALRYDAVGEALPLAEYVAVEGAAHFSALPRCSAFGVALIGLAGEDNICSDKGLRPRDAMHEDILTAIDGFLPESFGQP